LLTLAVTLLGTAIRVNVAVQVVFAAGVMVVVAATVEAGICEAVQLQPEKL
jgi:hypothetical protein